MYGKLVISAFSEVKYSTGKRKNYTRAKVLSDFIQEKTKQPYGEKSLVTKYKEAEIGKTVHIPDFVVEGLCEYLGFENYKSFQEANKQLGQTKNNESKKGSRKTILLAISLVSLLGILVWQYITRERWMEWQDPVYVEVDFNSEKLSEGKLKLYKEERIDNFKRIEPNCATDFFNPDGSPRIFYGKNLDGNYQWFTDLAKHPETGKPLKKITRYMIQTHICPKN